MKTGLLTIGLVTLDVVASPIDALPQGEGTTLIQGIACAPAGTAGGAAMVAARLGVPVKLASALGDDLIGRFVRMALEESKVDTSLLPVRPGMPTSTTVLAVDSKGRRPNFHALGAGMLASVNDEVMEAARQARFLHYGGVGGPKLDGGPGASLLQSAHEAGAIVTCDLISPQGSALDELKRLLPFVDYFMPSAAEALALTGTDDLDAAADVFLGFGAKACIIKNGGRGSHVVLPDARHSLPAHVITPVDTTSCGDSYCAGFIAALSRGWEPLEACRFATATAALVAQGLATLGKLESFEATEAAMRAMPLGETV
ncbi:MAG: sugar kinase [Pseudomonadota bacterium]